MIAVPDNGPYPGDALYRLYQKIRGRGGLVLSDATLSAVQAEATRAHLRHGNHSMLGSSYTHADRLVILAEEFGEVAKELTYDHAGKEGSRDRLVIELIQVAAMALSWVEVLKG